MTEDMLILAKNFNISVVQLELTACCNLRYAYSQESNPVHENADLNFVAVEAALSFILMIKPMQVHINGNGEPTLSASWLIVCERLLAAGIKVRLTTNFSKRFTEEEIRILSKLHEIQISLDALNEKKLNATHNKVDVRNVITNLVKLHQVFLDNLLHDSDHKEPVISFNFLLSPENFSELEDIIFLATVLKIKIINIDTGLKNSLPNNQVTLTDFSCLPFIQKKNISQYVIYCDELAKELGRQLWIGDRLQEILQIPNDQYSISVSAPALGETRRCFAPWMFLQLNAQQTIQPCYRAPIKLEPFENKQDILNYLHSESLEMLRYSLLNGNLNAICQHCRKKPIVSVETFRKAVADLFLSN